MMISIWNYFTEWKNINIWLRYSCLKVNREYIVKKTLAADSSETINSIKKLLLTKVMHIFISFQTVKTASKSVNN